MIKSERTGIDHRLGASIRAEREKQGLTARQLAKAAGLTPSALSQIERGQIDPSISSLRRIAESLSVPMFQFLVDGNDNKPDIVVRKADRYALRLPPWTVEYQLLTPGLKPNLHMVAYTLKPGEYNLPEPGSHEGDECILILCGEAEVEVAGVKYRLGPGDSIFIAGGLPHRVVNVGAAELEAVFAMSAPIL